ncbi:putative secondary metabolism biosynthetic enzyme [Neopestalotiopsis sp. 37M]|nr:putative secondary metabolism biosynthetic enzyme [Neopestalotiopsis sp. 37M]
MADNTSAIAYGRRLFPSYLDQIAKTNPGRVYAAIPKTADVEDGYIDVTIADLARCTNFMAKWIEDKFGKSQNFETITYVGLSDLRGVALFLAAIKTGHKALLASPRNPPASNLSLMEQTGSSKLLYSTELAPLITPFRAIAPPSFHVEAIPSFLEMLESNPEHYPYEKVFDEARDDPILVLHSSGSTGPPKPIVYTHGSFAAHDMQHLLPAPAGRRKRDVSIFEFKDEVRIYVIFPLFHLGGFVLYTFHTIFDTATIVIGPPHIPPHIGLLLSISRHQKLRGAMIVPALMDQLLHEPTGAGLELYKSLDFVIYGGAPLSSEVANKLAPLLELLEFYGSSETMPLPELFKDPADYQYHEFNPNLKFEMQPYDTNEGTFEMVILAKQSDRDTVALCHHVPGEEYYHTKDLFTRHPTKENLWKYFGRKDDILVLANGEKVNPIPLELSVQGNAALNGALLTGNGRNQTALIVEPKETLEAGAREELIRTLWPQVQQANNLIPGQGRVAQDKIICASPDRPFTRTGKATIMRSLTEKAYEHELESLYSGSSTSNGVAGLSLEATVKTTYETGKIVGFLRQVFGTSSFAAGATIGEDEDFYSYGLDSVQTLQITRNLKQALQAQTSNPIQWITPRVIFQNPTLADLAKVLGDFLNDGIVPDMDESSQSKMTRDAFESTVARHLDGLNLPHTATSITASSTSTVAILGSTGYLGRYLVATLLRNPSVSKIICLDRSADADQRQKQFLAGLGEDLPLDKLVFFKIEIGKPLLGLGRVDHDFLVREVDAVVYNSWRLDFGLSMRSFDPFLKASRHLVELAGASERKMRIIFVSSISSIGELAMNGVAPEEPVEDPSAAIPIGYGLSKLAVERILITANRQYGIPVSIVRVGQVGGPSSADPGHAAAGPWADQPWISAIAITSKSLGALPLSTKLALDWLPVDTIAAMLQAYILRPAEREAQIYNVVNRNVQSWNLVVDVLAEILGVSATIDFGEWVAKLEEIQEPTPEHARTMPALKMLAIYQSFSKAPKAPSFATDHASSVSQVEAPILSKELLSSWFRDWRL